jgi:beta-lactamase regulating signal transducer with metallopeptidase domain
MSALSAVRLDSGLATYVLVPALRSLALAAVAWALLAGLRVRDVSYRLAAWTAVLYAALAMPFLGRMMPAVPLPVPAVRTAPTAAAAAPSVPAATFAQDGQAAGPAVVLPGVVDDRPVTEAAAPAPETPMPQPKLHFSWLGAIAGVYFLVAGILLGRLGLGLVLSWRLRRRARVVPDEALAPALERETGKLGLRRVPQVAESEALSVPATLGVIRPMILLPPGWQEWNEGRTTAVLAHELSHIARRDPLRQLLGSLHRAIFWFSPLGWWLDSTLDELAELASDDAALRAGADRERYAEALLDFFTALKTARGRVRWQAVPMAQGARPERRLERILAGGRLSHRLGQAGFATVVLAAAPLICLAAAVHPIEWQAAAAPAAVPSLAAPPAPPAIKRVPETPMALAQGKPVPAPQPAPPTAPPAVLAPPEHTPATPPAPAMSEVAPAWPVWPFLPGWMHLRMSIGFACDEGQSLAIVSSTGSVIECGSSAEMEHVRELRSRIHGGFIWFCQDGRSYIIRDPATVQSAVEAYAAQENLSRQQAELGRQQAEMGGRQAALGMQQARVSVNIDLPDLTAMMQKMEAQLRTLDSEATQQALSRMQADLGEMQRRMGALQSVAGKKEADLGREQAALGQQQAALGRQQAALGEKQAAAARQAAERVRQLIKQALSKGLAKPE